MYTILTTNEPTDGPTLTTADAGPTLTTTTNVRPDGTDAQKTNNHQERTKK